MWLDESCNVDIFSYIFDLRKASELIVKSFLLENILIGDRMTMR